MYLLILIINPTLDNGHHLYLKYISKKEESIAQLCGNAMFENVV